MREFGARVAELSPHLAMGLCGIAAMAWATTATPPEFWLGNLGLGLVAGVFLVRLYKTSDVNYVLPYVVLLVLSQTVGRMVVSSPGLPLLLGGLAAFLGGALLTVSIRRRSVLLALDGDA